MDKFGEIRRDLDEGLSDRKSTRLNSSHLVISYAVFCLKKKNTRRFSQSPPLENPAVSRGFAPSGNPLQFTPLRQSFLRPPVATLSRGLSHDRQPPAGPL